MAEINLFRTEPNRRTLTPGEVLFEEGETADLLYGVISGSIEITVGGLARETVGAGGLLGETALLLDHVHSARAVAVEPSEVAEVDEGRFIALVKLNPFFAIEVMRILADRLRRETRFDS